MTAPDQHDPRTATDKHDQSSAPSPRRPRRLRVVVAIAFVVTVAVVALLVTQFWPRSTAVDPGPDRRPAAGEQSPVDGSAPASPSDSPDAGPPEDVPASRPEGPISLAELGVDLVVLGDDGTLATLTPDGDRRILTEGLTDGTDLRLAADGRGGAVWQPVDNVADVVHVDSQGRSSLLRSPGLTERIALVGLDHDRSRALVVRAVGTTPDDTVGDLLAIPLDGGESAVVREAITAWESGISFAAYGADVLLYGLFDAAFEGAFVWPDTGEPARVLEAGEMTGEYIRGVAIADASTGVVLVETASGFPDLPAARLLMVDLEHAEVTAEISVPVTLGAEDSWHVPRDVSAFGGFVLLNRYAEGTWLAPIVHDLASGGWAALDEVNGRAFLSGY